VSWSHALIITNDGTTRILWLALLGSAWHLARCCAKLLYNSREIVATFKTAAMLSCQLHRFQLVGRCISLSVAFASATLDTKLSINQTGANIKLYMSTWLDDQAPPCPTHHDASTTSLQMQFQTLTGGHSFCPRACPQPTPRPCRGRRHLPRLCHTRPIGLQAHGDILLVLPQGVSITDVYVIHPLSLNALPRAEVKVGAAAARRDQKRTAYERVEPNGYGFVPFSVETYGRLHQPAMKLSHSL
jgi:hypothetical protein